MLRATNGVIGAEVLAATGAKAWSLTHLASQIEWIWRPSGISVAVGSDAGKGNLSCSFPNNPLNAPSTPF